MLDLGCGWGSLALWAAARYPRSRFIAISNSHAQRAFIEAQAQARGLPNLEVRTADVRALELPRGGFDRVVSIEMFEHMRNYEALLARIAGLAAAARRRCSCTCSRTAVTRTRSRTPARPTGWRASSSPAG